MAAVTSEGCLHLSLSSPHYIMRSVINWSDFATGSTCMDVGRSRLLARQSGTVFLVPYETRTTVLRHSDVHWKCSCSRDTTAFSTLPVGPTLMRSINRRTACMQYIQLLERETSLWSQSPELNPVDIPRLRIWSFITECVHRTLFYSWRCRMFFLFLLHPFLSFLFSNYCLI